jgi:replicative DNA helicase
LKDRRDTDDPPPLLPHNLDVERSTLGAAMLEARAADYLVHRLVKDDYFRRAHQQLFEAIRALRTENVGVDLRTITAKLGKKGISDVGGPAYVSTLLDGVPRGTNVEHYADILQDLKTKRALVRFGQKVLEQVAGASQSSHDLLVEIDREVLAMQQGYDAGHMASLAETTTALLDNLQYRVDHKGQLAGVDTGFASINEQTQGWQAGDYVVLGARPSIGKTTLRREYDGGRARAPSASRVSRWR